MSTAPITVLRRALEQGTPLAPVHAVSGARLEEIEPGACVAHMTAPPDPHDAHPLLGLLLLADFALGVSVNGAVAAGERIATLRLALARVAPVAPGTPLVARARLDDAVGDALTSSAEITGPEGVLARASARNAVLRDELAETYGETPAAFDPAEPWSVDDLVATTEERGATVARPHPMTANSAGVVQGGLLAAISARALAVALHRVPDELTTTFLRASPAGGGPLRAWPTVDHGGRQLRSGRVRVSGAGERTLATTTGLAYGEPV